jgi:hypothetical protein
VNGLESAFVGFFVGWFIGLFIIALLIWRREL